MLIEDLIIKNKIDTIPLVLKPNFIDIPVKHFDTDIKGAEAFNVFYKAVKNETKLHKIVRAPKGGICIKKQFLHFPAADIIPTYSHKGKFTGLEITLLLKVGMCRLQFSTKPVIGVSGSTAFKEFKRIFKKFDIDLTDYAISTEEGKKQKDYIISPKIELGNKAFRNITFENVHHLDFHSSYPTGLINTHPEFRAPIEYMYEHRKDVIKNKKDWYKSVMNASIGFMQSQWSYYRYTNLAKDAINDNYYRIIALADKLKKSGHVVLSYNTDGIWYQGSIYHDKDEGKTLGTWANDYINCKFRAKSDGAYEFIETDTGKYHAVVRGTTRYDRIKNRDSWEWGDIYKTECTPILFKYDESEGIIYETAN